MKSQGPLTPSPPLPRSLTAIGIAPHVDDAHIAAVIAPDHHHGSPVVIDASALYHHWPPVVIVPAPGRRGLCERSHRSQHKCHQTDCPFHFFSLRLIRRSLQA